MKNGKEYSYFTANTLKIPEKKTYSVIEYKTRNNFLTKEISITQINIFIYILYCMNLLDYVAYP